MAAALQPLRNEPGQPAIYQRTLMNDYDFGDNVRYPTIRSQSSKPPSPPSHSYSSSQSMDRAYGNVQGPSTDPDARMSAPWAPSAGLPAQAEFQYPQRASSRQSARSPDYVTSPADQQPMDPPRSTVSYALPAGARRVVERYSLDDDGTGQRTPSRTSNETKPTVVNGRTDADLRNQSGMTQDSRLNLTGAYGRSASPNPPSSSFRKASSPGLPRGMANASASTSQYPPIMPLSASPAYSPPVAPTHRAYAQQPTYVTQANAMQTYTPIIPQEEVCMECAMRDQDMADVDVTSPGIWERASDAAFEDLRKQELTDEVNGVVIDNPARIRIRGGRLTEQNIKLWLSINPREPASRQQTLTTYIKAQRALLEAEAAAHNQAMQEAKQLDSRMRDAYSQLRRSAYDTGSSSHPGDDLGGVRIKPPVSPTSPHYKHNHAKSHSREITLLENGMIVEHVDVRKEEREARERRKRQERRARKSSKSSVMDVTSIISANSVGQVERDSLAPYSRYSQASSGRPTSVLTAPLDQRPDMPRAFSQASFSDFHSMGSSSPRRTRFFGMRNLSAGWKSQDSFAPSGMSGSMVDMHVALQREGVPGNRYSSSPIDLNTPRRSQIWPSTELEDTSQVAPDQTVKKKKGGLAKIWRIVTGKNDGSKHGDVSQYSEKQEDDLPLAPPPPLSYLVSRGPSAENAMRHASTPSLPSMPSPKFGQQSPGMSPPTAPSSLLPSPASLRRSGDLEVVGLQSEGNASFRYDGQDISKGVLDDSIVQQHSMNRKSVHSMKSESDSRQQSMSGLLSPPLPPLVPNRRPVSVVARDKSLPPLPLGEQPARVNPSDIVRPRTYYDARTLPPGSSPAHDFLPPQAPFRSVDNRRQSFGGTASRPNLNFQTMPVTKPVDFDAASNRSFGPKYDEFGSSRRSLGRLDRTQEQARVSSPLPKRKSKFGLSSLLGKKTDKRESEYMQENVEHQFPSMAYSPYDQQDDMTTNGYTTSTSRHSALSSNNPNPGPRMSVTSRKALEDLVQQDPDFVAYRYPSGDQRLDLLR